MSPLLHSVRDAALTGLEGRAKPWEIRPEDFFVDAETIREEFSGLIHSDADGIALAPSVSYGIELAARNLPLSSGQNIVTVHEQFPSNIYPWRRKAKEADAECRTVRFRSDDWTEDIVDAINDRTGIVAMPHVHWTTGRAFDLVRVGKKVRSVGGALVVDATQSLGVLSFDVNRIQPDFLVAAGYKALLGPYGLTFIHVAPEWRNGDPLEEGWLNRSNAADFGRLTEYCDDYMPGARRYDFGERANPILLKMAIASLQQIRAWGVDRIETYTRPLIEHILERADQAGFRHPPAAYCSPCMVGIELTDDLATDLAGQLSKRGIHVSVRLRNARVATHVYNTRDEIDRFFEVLTDLRTTGHTG